MAFLIFKESLIYSFKSSMPTFFISFSTNAMIFSFSVSINFLPLSVIEIIEILASLGAFCFLTKLFLISFFYIIAILAVLTLRAFASSPALT